MRTSLFPGATLSILSTYSLALSCLPLSHRYIPALYSAWSRHAEWRHVRLYVGIYIHVQCKHVHVLPPKESIRVSPLPSCTTFKFFIWRCMYPRKTTPDKKWEDPCTAYSAVSPAPVWVWDYVCQSSCCMEPNWRPRQILVQPRLWERLTFSPQEVLSDLTLPSSCCTASRSAGQQLNLNTNTKTYMRMFVHGSYNTIWL